MLRLQHCFTINDNLVTLDRNNFTGIFINEIFNPRFQNTSSQPSANDFLQPRTGNIHFISQTKYFKNILIRFKTDSS